MSKDIGFGMSEIETEECEFCNKTIVIAKDHSGETIILELAGGARYAVWRSQRDNNNSAATESGEYQLHRCKVDPSKQGGES